MNNSRTSLVTSDSDHTNVKSENQELLNKKPSRTRQRANFKNRLSELDDKINNNNTQNNNSDNNVTPRSKQSDENDPDDVNKNLINKNIKKKSKSKEAISRIAKGGQENETFELEDMKTETTNTHVENKTNQQEEATRKKRTRRAVKKNANQDQTETHQEDSNILAVIVHKSDKLRTDINIYNPVVRVHIVDLDTDGEYVTKTKKERDVLYFYEKVNRKLDFISPIMTSPYNFKENKSVIPKWEEIIVFNEEFSHFTKEKPNVIVLFELLDTVKSYETDSTQIKSYTSQDTSKSWVRIAWAFLKIVGADGSLNIEKKVRLQLYYSQHQYRVSELDSFKPEIFNLYKEGPRVKYPSSLHVTVKAILPPKTFTPSIGSYYLLEHEQFMQNIENETNPNITNASASNILYASTIKDHQGDETTVAANILDDTTNTALTDADIHKMKTKKVIWSRLAGLPCRIPNEKALTLNTSKKGCYSIKFSTSGSYLACGCIEDNNSSPIYIYDIPEGRLVMKYYGHFGLIYEMNWSKLDKYLVTASNDATSRVIDIENKSKDPHKILPHPTFVYTAKFHPDSLSIICTAGYDKVIRIWSIGKKNSKKSQKYGELLQELFGHSGYINSICFNSDGFYLYSADSAGSIKSWNAYSDKDVPRKEWTLKDDIKLDDIKNQSISYIQLHPSQFRIIAHMRDNQIKLIDLRLNTVVQSYKGAYNFNQNLKSSISACGTFLFSSGGDTKIHCWNVDTGDKVDYIDLNYVKPVRDIDFHPYDNFIAFCCYDTNAPVYIFGFNSEKAAKELFNSTMVLKTNNLENTVANKRLVQTLEPSNSKELALKESALKAKLADDIAKFNSYQANRWKTVQEKLDSVYPSQYDQNSNKNVTDFISSSITLSVVDQKNKPEFKYKGPKEAQDIFVALYDYKSQRSDELDLSKGDEILVLVKENDQWWMGELIKSKQEGYFPASYVQEKAAFEAVKKNTNFNSIRMPKFTVRDALSEYEKVYEDNALNSINRATSQLKDEVTNSKELPISNIRSIAINKNIRGRQNLDSTHIETINELPTKDTSSQGGSYHQVDVIKKRPFSHIIIKGAQ